MTADLRRATDQDASALAELARAAYAGYLSRLPAGVRSAPLDADYAVTIGRREVWVAERERRVCGFVVLDRAPDHLLLDNVAVHPDAQGEGVGRKLLVLAERRAAEQRFRSIRLHTHVVMVENQRLYERLGYVETGRRTECGLDRVFYEKQL